MKTLRTLRSNLLKMALVAVTLLALSPNSFAGTETGGGGSVDCLIGDYGQTDSCTRAMLTKLDNLCRHIGFDQADPTTLTSPYCANVLTSSAFGLSRLGRKIFAADCEVTCR